MHILRAMAALSSPKSNTIRIGSPKLSMATASATEEKDSLEGGGAKKIGGSPSGKSRAYWSPSLEKSLVVLLHEHNNTSFRDEHKWYSKTWNKIVKEFHKRNPHVSFTKGQIQDKEQDLKRNYKILKEARRQSEFTWNEDRCMIEAAPASWDKFINKFPKAKRFRNNKSSFPLFDELRKLYDGHLAEGAYNFISDESPQDPPLRQVDNTSEVQDSEELMAYDGDDDDTEVQQIEDEDANSEWNKQILQRSADSLPRDVEDEDASVEMNGRQRRGSTESRNEEGKEAKRCKSSNIEGLEETYLDMRTKQVENKAAQVAKIKEAAQGTDFSIKRCVSVLNSMEVTKEEKAKAYAIFKNQDNREIFLSACSEDPESAMIWLRTEML